VRVWPRDVYNMWCVCVCVRVNVYAHVCVRACVVRECLMMRV
jgi:hypothetical protein